jgi:versiconal hemiacetal acetate esterase
MIGTAEELRAQYTQLQEMLRAQLPPPSDAVDTKDGEVDGIKCRLYTPKEASKQGPLPVTLWLHGGGWVTGDIDGDDLQCREVAEAVPSIVINVDYRLAPEHKIPTGLQDTLTVLNWVSSFCFTFTLRRLYS